MKELTDPAKIKAANTYNAAADYFDDKALSFWNKYGTNTVNRLYQEPGMKVIDVACGSGASALPAALAVGESGNVVAIDLAQNLLDLGAAKAYRLGLQNIQFIMGDMTDLGYPDNSFDAVICVFGIFFVPDMASLLKELWRVIKPKGKLAVTTWGPNLFAPLYDVWKEEVKKERPDLYSSFNPWDRITDVQSLTELFNSAGIKTVDVVAENSSHILETPDDWWRIVLGSGFRWTIDKLGAEAAISVRNKNLEWIKTNNIKSIETNVIYGFASKEE
ncbi:MAG: methyltransferase domain-containing protein [Sphingobacteriales bacterium]|nr:MAG: methyltransferase domain-containing protein [Sphingobacteriales bacterium]